MVACQRGVHPSVIAATPDRWLALTVGSIAPIALELVVEPLLGLGAKGVEEVEGC